MVTLSCNPTMVHHIKYCIMFSNFFRPQLQMCSRFTNSMMLEEMVHHMPTTRIRFNDTTTEQQDCHAIDSFDIALQVNRHLNNTVIHICPSGVSSIRSIPTWAHVLLTPRKCIIFEFANTRHNIARTEIHFIAQNESQFCL